MAEPSLLEIKVNDAFTALDLDAVDGERTIEGANVQIPVGDGKSMQATALPPFSNNGKFRTSHERQINDVTVTHVRYLPNGPAGEAFSCAHIQYEIRGAVPPGYDDIDDFLADYITALECPNAT